MTQQEQFEADYLAAFPELPAPLFGRRDCAYRVWLQQAKRHEAEKAELVEALRLARNGVGHTHYVDAVIAQYEVKK